MPQKKVILLVEDNSDDQILTTTALKEAKILNEVVIAQDGEEALDFLFGTGAYKNRDTAITPQVVLLDLKLPKLNGMEVLERIRSDSRTKLLPVVILTSSKDVVNGYKLGANSFIQKPVDFHQFTEAVRQLGLYWMLLNEAP